MEQYEDLFTGLGEQLQPHGVPTVAYSSSLIAKVGPALCYGLTGYNSGPNQWVQVFDMRSVPATGGVPVTIVAVPAATNFSIDYGSRGRAFQVGVVVSNSTTGPTLTAGASDCWFDVVLI